MAHPSKAKTLKMNNSAILILGSNVEEGRIIIIYLSSFKSEKYFCSKGIESYPSANIAMKIKVSEGCIDWDNPIEISFQKPRNTTNFHFKNYSVSFI